MTKSVTLNSPRRGKKLTSGNIAYLYILPWIIGFLVFQLYPLLASLFYSFMEYDIIGAPKFVGLDNYIFLFTKDLNWGKSVKATFLYVMMEVPGRMIFSLFIAMLLNLRIRGIGFFRTMYYLPSILGGSVAMSIVWRALFYTEGTINGLIGMIGLGPVDWLGNPNIAIYTLGILSIWQFGSPMVIFLAGLKQIPEELYEAARVEGASSVRMFVSITMPMLSPIILFNLVMNVCSAFQSFTGAFVVTNGGPMKSTYLIVMKLYEEAFMFFKMGYACAISWVLFIVIALFTVIIFRTAGLWVFYSDGKEAAV